MASISVTTKSSVCYTTYILADERSDKIGRRINSLLCSTDACINGIINVKYLNYDASTFDNGAIILLLGGEKAAERCPHGLPIAVSSSNRSALRILANRNHHALICGMYSHDTFTLSSYDRDCALVALQRTLLSIDGQEIEPREIKVHLRKSIPSPDIPLLAAAMLLNGCCQKDEFEI